jgi:hypothetical protein
MQVKNKIKWMTLHLIVVDHLSVYFNERTFDLFYLGVCIDKYISCTVGSSSKLFAWFILYTLTNNTLTVGLYHLIIFFSSLPDLSGGEIEGGIHHCIPLHHINQIKRKKRLIFPVIVKRLPHLLLLNSTISLSIIQ